MYNTELSNESFAKFEKFLMKYIEELESSILEAKSASMYKIMNELRKSKNPSDILMHKSDILLYDESLVSSFDVIEFFVSNGIFEAEQISEEVNKIINAPFVSNLSKGNSKIDVNEVTLEIERVKNILSNNEYDFDYYVSLVEKSDLSKADKLNIYAYFAYDSCHVELEETLIDEDEVEKVSISSLTESYEPIRNEINAFISENYSVIDDLSKDQLSIAKSTYSMVINSPEASEVNNRSYSHELLVAFMLAIIDKIREIDEDIRDNSPYTDEVTIEIINEEINELKSYYEKASTHLGYIREDVLDQEYPTPSNIHYLVDERGNCLFDAVNASHSEKIGISKCISKLERGIREKYRKSRPAMVRNRYGRNIYLMSSKGGNKDIYISYMKLDPSKGDVLILTYGGVNDDEIYDKTTSLLEKYNDRLEDFIAEYNAQTLLFLSHEDAAREYVDSILPNEEMKL